MIESLLCQTCTILHRQTDSRNSFNEYSYSTEEDVKCFGVSLRDKDVKDDKAINLSFFIRLYLKVEIKAFDKVIYRDNTYIILDGGVEKSIDIITGEVQFYMVDLRASQIDIHPPEVVNIRRNT